MLRDMPGLVMKVVPLVVLLCGLVFVHELGHFLVAKFFRVKVLKFSIGFGPRIFAFTRGETEYRLAMLPLGGYVKMAGDVPGQEIDPADAGRGFLEQTPLVRGLIAVAGPAFNLVFPLLLYFGLFLVPHDVPSTRIGYVVPGRPAALAGVQPGDRILSVDGVATQDFNDLRDAIEHRPGQALALALERAGQKISVTVTAASDADDNPVEPGRRGRIGIAPYAHAPIIGVIPGSPAALAGLATFDRIVRLDGKTVETYEALAAALISKRDTFNTEEPALLATGGARRRGAKVDLQREGKPIAATLTPGPVVHGLESEELYLYGVEAGSPAATAGLLRGDKILSIDGRSVTTWDDVDHALRASSDAHHETLTVQVRSGDGVHDSVVHPTYKLQRDQMGARVLTAQVGLLADSRPESIVAGETVRVANGPLKAARLAAQKLVELIRVMTLGILRILQGRISYETIGGPILLYQVAAKSAEVGWDAFFWTMGVISVNLGLMNLLPIPVLDGWHIFAAGVESVRRRPLSIRFREIANAVGLALLAALTLLVFRNDIMRSFFE